MIYLAPIQGFTDYIFRDAYLEVFEDIDKYFIPYITVNHSNILHKHEREILPENNRQEKVVPQILAKDEAEFEFLLSILESYGYSEVNLNMGCPYPMATNRGRGAALLEKPDVVRKMLELAFSNFNLKVSVKLRAGMTEPDQIQQIIPVLNDFPINEVILHPRIAKQLYKGSVYDLVFRVAVEQLEHQLVYNGDIFTVDDFQQRSTQFSQVSDWMLGRGVLMNLFLPAEIKGKQYAEEQKRFMLLQFHQLISESHLQIADNQGNALNKLKQFWIYFSYHFVNQARIFKKIKKIRSIDELNAFAFEVAKSEVLK